MSSSCYTFCRSTLQFCYISLSLPATQTTTIRTELDGPWTYSYVALGSERNYHPFIFARTLKAHAHRRTFGNPFSPVEFAINHSIFWLILSSIHPCVIVVCEWVTSPSTRFLMVRTNQAKISHVCFYDWTLWICVLSVRLDIRRLWLWTQHRYTGPRTT